MRIFTPEAAEQVISLLCYSRTQDTYEGCVTGRSETVSGAFRLAVTVNQQPTRLTLSDNYDITAYHTLTVRSAIRKGLLQPSWEDLASRLYLNDQDILYMCLMSLDEPVCLRLIDAERIIAYRNSHTDTAKAKRFTYLPGRPKERLRLAHRRAGSGYSGHERTGKKSPYGQNNNAA